MRILFSYIYYRRTVFAVLIAASAVFSTVFLLYNAPSEPLRYAFLLTAVICLPILIGDFIGFVRRHRVLSELKSLISEDISLLPEPKNLPERDYDELLKLLADERAAAQSEKSRAVRDMGEYYTLWAHQIKTPIAAMRLILQNAPESEDNYGIEEQLFRIEQYVGMVLTYIRSEDSASDYVVCPCELDPLVRAVLRRYRKSFIRKHITLDFTETNQTVLSDEKWLSFALEQLLSNSLKYTPEGGLIRVFSPENGKLSVSDNGIGIAPEDLPRIGEKGFTGYNGRLDKKSTGIGLYLVKKVLTGLSHGFNITSAVGEGTTVTISFPVDKSRYD